LGVFNAYPQIAELVCMTSICGKTTPIHTVPP
jgi:hypothetical protein